MKYQFDLPTLSMIQKAEKAASDDIVTLKFTYNTSEEQNTPSEFKYNQNSKRYYVMLGEFWTKDATIMRRIGEQMFHQVFELYLKKKDD